LILKRTYIVVALRVGRSRVRRVGRGRVGRGRVSRVGAGSSNGNQKSENEDLKVPLVTATELESLSKCSPPSCCCLLSESCNETELIGHRAPIYSTIHFNGRVLEVIRLENILRSLFTLPLAATIQIAYSQLKENTCPSFLVVTSLHLQ
jgi:hypothetical protein